MRPNVLLATTCRWFSAARLAIAFRDAGCAVDAVCPTGHPIALISALGRLYPYRGLAPLASFHSAIEASQPDIIIPCDDLACAHLHAMHAQAQRIGKDGALRTLVEHSLGDPLQYSLIDSRSQLIALARDLKIDAPVTCEISSEEELRDWIAEIGLPIGIKSDGTSGGLGVRIAKSEAEALRAFTMLNLPPRFLRAAKRALVDRDRTLLLPWIQRRRPAVSVQRYLPYDDATIAVACWRGEIMASISAVVLRTWKPKGPASVVRIIDNELMLTAAQKLASRLKLSGLCGFDFLVERGTGRAHLIEMNARATQICHLALGSKRNLPVALTSCVSGTTIPASTSTTENNVIALFPLEWQNDPASPYLSSGYHDVPWMEPKLVQACVESRMRNGGTMTYENLSRILAHLPWRR